MLQHGAYTLLIDACYDREEFPTLSGAIDWLWASTEDEVSAVKFVLSKFFTLENDVYTQKRIKEDLAKYHENSKTNKRIAIEREANRREKSTKRAQDVNEEFTVSHGPTPNQEPLTINQEPLTINQEPLTKNLLKDISPSAPSAKADNIPYLKIKDLWNKHCPNLKGVRDLTQKRKTAIKKLWNQKNDQGEYPYRDSGFYIRWFDYCNDDPWYNGTDSNSTGWIADFLFCMKVDNILGKQEG